MLLLAETMAIDGNTAVSGVLVISIVLAALKVRSWITDESKARVAADHQLELKIAALDQSSPAATGTHRVSP